MSLTFYSKEEDNNREESVDNYKKIFIEYEKKLPSLSEALKQMFQNSNLDTNLVNDLTDDIIDKCQKTIDKNYEQIKKKYDKISKDDAYIICAYTCESKKGQYSPYKLLNQNLVSDNRQNGIKNISKYLYIFLKSLRKLTRYYPTKTNKYLYRCIRFKVNLSKDPFNDKMVPYITGNKKTFWGFTSTSMNPNITYNFLKDEKSLKTGTIFILGGDVWGYDITLFNYYGEKEILLEPERKFIIDNVLPPLNELINVTCKILKTPLILKDEIKESNYNNESEIHDNIDDIEISKYIATIETEIKINDNPKYISGMGLLCNIPIKNIKALITYQHILNLDFLNKAKKLSICIDEKEIDINMKRNRYKYTNKELDITIIEILKEDNINYFIEIDKFISSKNHINENILCIPFNNMKKIEIIENKITDKVNNNYIYSNNLVNEGILIFKNNFKLLGLIKADKNSEIIPMNIIIDKINFIKCKLEIKKDDLGKKTQIINNTNILYFKNEEIEKEVNIIINGEILSNMLTYQFNEEGLYNIYIISYNNLTNMSYMFCECKCLKDINFSSFNTKQVKNMSYMFYECESLTKLDLSTLNTNQVEDMSFMFMSCSSLQEINLSSFNTYKTKYMQNMFCYCESLKEINLSSFNTSNLTDMRSLFSQCKSLKEINLFSFNTSRVTLMSNLFGNCFSLIELNISSFDTSEVTDMSSMFNGCHALKQSFK